eukprot:sb/3477970/
MLSRLFGETWLFDCLQSQMSGPNQTFKFKAIALRGDGDCKEGWTGFYGRCFKVGDKYKGGISWDDAENKCRAMGATLVAANDIVLMRFISTDSRLANVQTIWLG